MVLTEFKLKIKSLLTFDLFFRTKTETSGAVAKKNLIALEAKSYSDIHNICKEHLPYI